MIQLNVALTEHFSIETSPKPLFIYFAISQFRFENARNALASLETFSQ